MSNEYKIAAIIGITEAIKQYGISSKYCPTIAIIVGAALGYAEKPTSDGILEGIVLGATITGGYAVIKNSSKGVISSIKTPYSPKTPNISNLEPDDYRGV